MVMTAIRMAAQKTAKIAVNETFRAASDPTRSGPKMPPILPTAAVVPEPVARIAAGYCSGV